MNIETRTGYRLERLQSAKWRHARNRRFEIAAKRPSKKLRHPNDMINQTDIRTNQQGQSKLVPVQSRAGDAALDGMVTQYFS
ncbi:uncharacterized protein PV06_05570 [Exophiala oligosperma]|uniref:Uncharacterized protein n=1 Tax=Exophiala oligosperma TaxID=215243 RepID=A0A0D2APY2_9EURO|nr:uncharacterized protein PV06_05570 [Exophiala oligosperma]KIW41976.1 hypothetical protein PV06_05570 [Exophiala oligosperma]